MIGPAQVYQQLDAVRSHGAEPLDLLHPRPTYTRINDADSIAISDNIELDSLDTAYDPDTGRQHGSKGALLSNSTFKKQHTYEWSDASSWRKLFAGWRLGATWAAIFAIISLCINVGVLIRISTSHKSDDGLIQIYTGSCEKVRRMGIWVHLGINVLSTFLLAGSNYCMQCLSSPTRKEIDKAHAKARYLDIGILSLRNIFSVAKRRQLMWWLLALTSIPLHLMYNSAFYGSLAVSDYDIFLTNPNDIAGANFTTRPLSCSEGSYSADVQKISGDVPGDFYRLDPLDCIKSYAHVIMTDRRNLILVSSNATQLSNHSLQHLESYDFENHVDPGTRSYSPFNWICESDPQMGSKIDVPSFKDPNSQGLKTAPCDAYVSRVEAIVDQWAPYGYELDYCLSEKIPESCSFNANTAIIAVVTACNVVKAIIMLIVAFGLGNTPLITIGDAIESFLNKPDPTTAGRCWLDRSHADTCEALWQPDHNKAWPKTNDKPNIQPDHITAKRLRWYSSAGGWRWTVTITLYVSAIGTSLGLLGYSLSAISVFGQSLAGTGFGQLQTTALVVGWSIQNMTNPSSKILAAILVANTPQLILSFLYLNFNGLLTSMWVAAEWSDFVHERKYLRVSNPKGQQRSTHFLQLPYKIAVPLIVTSGLLHWLISQSFFLAVISWYSCSGELRDPTYIATCGFSPEAILITICVALLIPVVTVVVSHRRLAAGIPLAGSCSVAISAACHAPEWDEHASLRPVQYGCIPDHDTMPGVGHCSFTSGEVCVFEKRKLYA